MTKQELIDKIKKLLALSNANGATEPEKNLALNRAKDLMAQFAIEECDLKSEKINELIITEDYVPKLENPLPSYLFNPALFNSILQPICNNFGCYCSFYLHKNGQQIMGFKANIEIAKYACDVLLNTGIKDFRAEYKKVRSIGFVTTFWNGFASGIAQRFTKLSNETAIVLYDKVKLRFNESVGQIKIELPSSNEQSGFLIGKKSATEAQLNPAVSKGNGGNLLS